jgi:hypothetical protein
MVFVVSVVHTHLKMADLPQLKLKPFTGTTFAEFIQHYNQTILVINQILTPPPPLPKFCEPNDAKLLDEKLAKRLVELRSRLAPTTSFDSDSDSEDYSFSEAEDEEEEEEPIMIVAPPQKQKDANGQIVQ